MADFFRAYWPSGRVIDEAGDAQAMQRFASDLDKVERLGTG